VIGGWFPPVNFAWCLHNEHTQSSKRSTTGGDSRRIIGGLFAAQHPASECPFRPATRKDHPTGSAFSVRMPPFLLPMARCSVGALGDSCDCGAGGYHLVRRICCATRERAGDFSRLDGCHGRVLRRRCVGAGDSVQHHPVLRFALGAVQAFTPTHRRSAYEGQSTMREAQGRFLRRGVSNSLGVFKCPLQGIAVFQILTPGVLRKET
jgi:hypothetical protein